MHTCTGPWSTKAQGGIDTAYPGTTSNKQRTTIAEYAAVMSESPTGIGGA